MIQPVPSLAYGVAVFAVSLAIVWTLFALGMDYILFPALAGFMVVGPLIAIGLYEKSRAIAANQPVSLMRMIFVKAKSGAQVWFTGAILCLLMLLWMRAAVLLYALFFGVTAFPGLDHVVVMLLGTLLRLGDALVGTAVGGLFAAFAFAISIFAVPMLLDQRRRPHRHGHQHVAGVEQSCRHGRLGPDGARALRCVATCLIGPSSSSRFWVMPPGTPTGR